MCSGPAPVCTVYIFLIVEWFVFLVLGLYFDQVISFGGRDRKHPLFFLGPLRRIISLSHEKRHVVNVTEESSVSSSSLKGVSISGDGSDDVRMEHEFAERFLYSTEYGLCISHLSKWFPGKPPKRAVNDLSLAIRKNEVFGLLGKVSFAIDFWCIIGKLGFLGHNGAGKTTTMNVIVGQLQADGGKVVIDGFDLKTQRKHVLSRLGICPQFDILWSDLTGKGKQ